MSTCVMLCRECPLDLKEAISSICFAAPRCADLPELLQVQLSFASKYGKEFVAAATELMPNCGVNRQLIELLSVRAPPPEKKLKLLKEIAEEHEIDWDPSPSETELLKPHEDLLNGPTNFVGGSKVPLPDEKHDDILQSPAVPVADEHYDSEEDELDFPEVPKVPLRPGPDSFVGPSEPSASHRDPDNVSQTQVQTDQNMSRHSIDPNDILRANERELHESSANPMDGKQFLPFISPPSFSPAPPSLPNISPTSVPVREINQSPSPSKLTTDAYRDLNDVLASARAAAESAERAAAAARSAASLAEMRISEFSKTKSDPSLGIDTKNPFFASNDLASSTEKLHLDDRNDSSGEHFENDRTFDEPKVEFNANNQELPFHQPQRISSLDSETDFSYPNLFHSQSGKLSF